MKERIFAIGDIHGCLDRLQRLLDTIPFQGKSDRLAFIGDYIDRGPDSKGVVDLVIKLRNKYPNTICIKGNHEAMLLDYLEGRERELYIMNGGEDTLESYNIARGQNALSIFPRDHLDFFRSLPFFFETEEYIFVHAGLRPKVSLHDQKPYDMIWIRENFYCSKAVFEKTVVFGHTPFQKPLVLPDKIGIDTGAVYGNKLTCVELPAVEFYQA